MTSTLADFIRGDNGLTCRTCHTLYTWEIRGCDGVVISIDGKAWGSDALAHEGCLYCADRAVGRVFVKCRAEDERSCGPATAHPDRVEVREYEESSPAVHLNGSGYKLDHKTVDCGWFHANYRPATSTEASPVPSLCTGEGGRLGECDVEGCSRVATVQDEENLAFCPEHAWNGIPATASETREVQGGERQSAKSAPQFDGWRTSERDGMISWTQLGVVYPAVIELRNDYSYKAMAKKVQAFIGEEAQAAAPQDKSAVPGWARCGHHSPHWQMQCSLAQGHEGNCEFLVPSLQREAAAAPADEHRGAPNTTRDVIITDAPLGDNPRKRRQQVREAIDTVNNLINCKEAPAHRYVTTVEGSVVMVTERNWINGVPVSRAEAEAFTDECKKARSTYIKKRLADKGPKVTVEPEVLPEHWKEW